MYQCDKEPWGVLFPSRLSLRLSSDTLRTAECILFLSIAHIYVGGGGAHTLVEFSGQHVGVSFPPGGDPRGGTQVSRLGAGIFS